MKVKLQDTDIPSTSFSTNLPEVTNDGNEVGTSRPSGNFEKVTGFALYDSYRSVVDIDDDAPKYVFVDANRLVKFLEGFSCPVCVSTLQVSHMAPKGYANFFDVVCKDCDFHKSFDTSDRVRLSEDDFV